jgi:hypothetical protein
VWRGTARWAALTAAACLAAVTAGCGGGAAAAGHVTFVAAGQLPASAYPSGIGNKGAGATKATVPLAKANPISSLFTAVGIFQACLTSLGVTFVGAPSAANPNSPADNPTYLQNLKTCAARSNILQALQTEQSAQDNLTPAQVKKENEQYLRWRKCMIGRGWGIPPPTPNAKGLLFSFGGGSGGTSGFKPPPGQSILSSPDLQACANQSQTGSS